MDSDAVRAGEQRTGIIDALDLVARSGTIADRRGGRCWCFDGGDVLGQGFDVLRAGDAVEFTLAEGPDGLIATRVARIVATNEPPLAAPPPDESIPPPLEDAPG